VTFEIIVTPSAKADIFETYTWLLENKARSVSDKWLWLFSEACISLRSFPRRCALSLESPAFDVEVRELLFGSRPNVYRILFSIQAEKIYVLRVRSTRRNRINDQSETDDTT
jgi:plasmid stabilization system protein ParE